MLLTQLRWLFATAIILPLAWLDLKRDWPVLRQHLAFMFCLGAAGFACYNTLFYLALNHTSAINVTILQSAMPLMVFLGNRLLFGVRFSAMQVVGFALTLFGVALVVAQGTLSTLLQLDLNRGDLLILLAVLFYGGYTLALRYKPTVHWRSAIAVLASSASLACLPFTAFEVHAGNALFPDWTGLAVVAYIGIFPSLFAQTLYMRGVELIGANRANLFINLVPVFGAILAVFVLGEHLRAYHLAALITVLGGIYLAEQGTKTRQPDVTR
jgi:drug/metabolite transporter (DMT)-like permease